MSQNGRGLNQPLWLLLFFCGGVIGVRFLPGPGPPVLVAASMLGALITGYRYPSVRWICAAMVGLGWAALISAQLLSRSIPQQLEKQDLVVIGRVEGIARSTDRGSRFDFRVESMFHQQRPLASPGRVRLSTYDSEIRPQSGQRWRFTVRLKRPHGFSNPGAGFDYETWLFNRRIRSTGYVVAGMAERLPGDKNANYIATAWHDRLLQARLGFAGFIDQVVANPVAAGILSALSVGIRDELGEAEWKVLQDTGTIHLVAISGLHIGFIALIAGAITARLWRISGSLCGWLPAMTVGALSGLCAGLLYAMLAGFTLPTRRAVGMLLVAVVVILSRRRSKPLTLLAGVLAGILVIDPLAPLSSSFWLSFTAVSILLLIATARTTRPRANRTANYLAVGRKWGVMQCWLLLGMMPILLAGFQKISLVAPVGNLVAVPLIGMLVVPLVLAGFVCWLAGLAPIAEILLAACSWLLERVWGYLEWLASQSWAVWYQGLPPLWTLLFASAGIVLVMAGRALPGRWLGLAWLLPMLLVSPARPDQGEFKLMVLDVGQGLGSVIQTRDHLLVFDAGAAYAGGFNLGKVVMVPTLRYLAAQSIDRLIISHSDNDHIGGASALVDAIETDALLTSDPSRGPMQGQPCEQGMTWQWDGVDFEMLWPPPGLRYQRNDSSCVLRVSSGAGSVLLTGDIEEPAERKLVRQYGDRLRSDVLVVPHHGSKSSSSPVLLGSVEPRIGLVSAGYLNRFGHPAGLVVRRFRAREIPLLNTADEGAITIQFSATEMRINGQRDSSPAFWKQHGNADFMALNKLLNAD